MTSKHFPKPKFRNIWTSTIQITNQSKQNSTSNILHYLCRKIISKQRTVQPAYSSNPRKSFICWKIKCHINKRADCKGPAPTQRKDWRTVCLHTHRSGSAPVICHGSIIGCHCGKTEATPSNRIECLPLASVAPTLVRARQNILPWSFCVS